MNFMFVSKISIKIYIFVFVQFKIYFNNEDSYLIKFVRILKNIILLI